MRPLRIAIVAESTGLSVREAVTQAARMAVDGVEFDAAGVLAPDALGDTGRREFRNLLRSFNQQLAALTVPLRHGLDVPENLQPRLEHIRKVLQLAYDLGARSVVVPCPAFPRPDDAGAPRAATLRESLSALASFGDRIGAAVALEIGFDAGERVASYLADFDSGSLKVTYDPASFLVHGHDPIANLTPLKAYLAHVHARDARSQGVNIGFQEAPLGAGDVDWMVFAATLQSLDFDGFLAVKRDQGETRRHDVAAGVRFLRRFTGAVPS